MNSHNSNDPHKDLSNKDIQKKSSHPKPKKVPGKKKKKLTPEERKKRKEQAAQRREQNTQKKSIRELFSTMEFDRIPVEHGEFFYNQELPRVELDDIFYSDNIILIVEYTVTQSGEKAKEHLRKKRQIATYIRDNQLEFEDFLIKKFPNHIKESGISREIKYLYCSKYPVSEELKAQYTDIVIFFSGHILKYFRDIAAIIHSFAKHEFNEFLGIDKTSNQKNDFTAYIVNNTTSKYEHQYALITFYATPEALLSRSYVLRTNSWRNPDDCIYQRHLKKEKVAKIREYLKSNGQSFPNNIIVTLRHDSVSFSFKEKDHERKLDLADAGYFTYQDGKKGPRKLEGENQTIKLTITDQYGAIGIIDGQHRLFSYAHPEMETQRGTAKLLVTGILLPSQHSENASRRLEAKLFKSINTPQTAPPQALNLYIEEMLTPCTAVSINKRIVECLANEGMPLHKIIPKRQQVPDGLIPTSSIISYGLNTYLRFTSNNENGMFSIWKRTIEYTPKMEGTPLQLEDEDAQAYISFASSLLKNYLIAFKKQLKNGQWDKAKRSKSNEEDIGILSSITIAGIIRCMQKYLETHPEHATLEFDFTPIMNREALKSFDFKNYSGSTWKKLGDDLYEILFNK